jgi:hypothetical protein
MDVPFPTGDMCEDVCKGAVGWVIRVVIVLALCNGLRICVRAGFYHETSL